MINHRAVVVHGLGDARAALAPGLPVTLLSAPGAALFAGCLWWREVVRLARAAHPGTSAADVLDCADAPGRAMEALRCGQEALVLAPQCPAFSLVVEIAREIGAVVLPARPPALDLAEPGALRRLEAWLRAG